jgi:hypothetical protein
LPGTPDPRGLEWDTWTDFSPGIISQSKYAYAAFGTDNGAPVPYKGPSVAAQPDGTFGCIALPNGGLGPMPGRTGTLLGPSAAFQNGVDNWITGVLVYGVIEGGAGGSPGDELLFCIDSVDSSDLRKQCICALQTGGAWNRILKTSGPASSVNGAGEVYGFSAVLTMANASDSTGAATGTAVVAMTTAFINDAAAIGATGILLLYPDPTNPSKGSAPFYKDYSADLPGQPDGETGIIFGHQGRIVIFQQNDYLWTGSEVLGGPYDQIYYTDPANTVPGNGNTDSLKQDVVFVQEWPVGAGAWGSMSAGELFVVKHRGGGYIVSGDLNEPTVTFLAGVTPAYGTTVACQTPIGLIYLSTNNGCWLWNGSNVSQKISNQLNDDFFRCPPGLPAIGQVYQAFSWVDMVVTSNNWVYDTVTGGWWILDDQTPPFMWFGQSWDSNVLYAFPPMVTSDTDPICYTYDKTQPANSYQWTSYPMPRSIFKSIVVREVVVRAQGFGTITVVLQGVGGSTDVTVPVDVDVNSTLQPVYLRFDTGIEAQDVTVQVTATGDSGGPAPIIYGISTGVVQTLLVGPT